MFKHILVPTDGSKLSVKAAKAAIKLAMKLIVSATIAQVDFVGARDGAVFQHLVGGGCYLSVGIKKRADDGVHPSSEGLLIVQVAVNSRVNPLCPQCP